MESCHVVDSILIAFLYLNFLGCSIYRPYSVVGYPTLASHWKATIHIYNLKNFQKIQKFIAFMVAYPKSLNSMYGIHRSLGINNKKLINKYFNAIFYLYFQH